MQYTGQQAWDKLEIRVYPGADGTFTLYEDEGDNYNYEQGVFSTITFSWDESRQVLTIGSRQGSFPGMLNSRLFHVVWPDGTSKDIKYEGEEITVKAQ
jgi:alpha-D-xyloside xylohydrolase